MARIALEAIRTAPPPLPLAGAKRHRLEPWTYLRDLILQLAVDASRDSMVRLLPDRWAQLNPEHVLTHRLEESRQKAQRATSARQCADPRQSKISPYVIALTHARSSELSR
jgi:hypothetical protein